MNQKSNGPDETSGSYCAATGQSKAVPERRAPTSLAGTLRVRFRLAFEACIAPVAFGVWRHRHLLERKQVG
jgi:hypothetical protein